MIREGLPATPITTSLSSDNAPGYAIDGICLRIVVVVAFSWIIVPVSRIVVAVSGIAIAVTGPNIDPDTTR